MALRLFAHGTPTFLAQRKEIGALINQRFHSNNDVPVSDWWITYKKDNRIVGVACFMINRDNVLKSLRSNIYLCNLCVHSDYTRRGIATAILKKSQEYFSGWIYDRLYWKVEHDNHAAIALYEKYGASVEKLESFGRIITYYVNLHAQL